MLLPEGFWMLFTLVVVAGMAATAAVAVLVSVLTSGGGAGRGPAARRPRVPAAGPLPRPERHDHRSAA